MASKPVTAAAENLSIKVSVSQLPDKVKMNV